MIEMTKAEEKRSAPAESLRELRTRLTPYIGSVIQLEWATQDHSYVGHSYRLRGMSYTEAKNSKEEDLRLDFDSNHFTIPTSTNLKVTYSVLIDGQWKMIHDPSARRK